MVANTAELTTNPNAIITILLHPDLVKHAGIAHNGPIRFPIPKGTGNVKGSKDQTKVEMSMDGEFLSPDQPNFLTLDQFKQLETHRFYAWATKKGVIEIVTPLEDSKHTGTTADFDEADAYNLIQATGDIEWLRRCINKDERNDIGVWCQERIKELQEELAANNQGN